MVNKQVVKEGTKKDSKAVIVIMVIVLVLIVAGSIVYENMKKSKSSEDKPLISEGSEGEEVEALNKKLTDLGYLAIQEKEMTGTEGKVNAHFGTKNTEALRELQLDNAMEVTGFVRNKKQLEEILGIEKITKRNLAVGTSSEWSEWMTPSYNVENKCFDPYYALIGEKEMGDYYTCSVEIQFKDVTATKGQKFGFRTQGIVNSTWDSVTIWNRGIVDINEIPPKDGVYQYVSSNQITKDNVNMQRFDLGFRCDYWASGSFRVRNVKVEKGTVATEWCPSFRDYGDGSNLVVDSSEEWSKWMSPEYGKENEILNPFYVDLGEKQWLDFYTCSLEIEFKNVTATKGEKFSFCTQGAVDKSWEIDNIWDPKIIKLDSTPKDGVYQYKYTSQIGWENEDAKRFDIGFRCDYWASGSFRVRKVKVEKGSVATEWSPGPKSATASQNRSPKNKKA